MRRGLSHVETGRPTRQRSRWPRFITRYTREMSVEPLSFAELPPRILDEVTRQFRTARNDVLRFGVWNTRNLTDDDFNHADDHKLLGYFRQDLLETRLLSKGRRVDLVQVWCWFDDQMNGKAPLLMREGEVMLNVQDKDLEKVRKRIEEIQSFLPILRSDDFDGFKRVKYKLRRTVMRLTYDLHHLSKRLDKYRKGPGASFSGHEAAHADAAAEAIAPPPEAIAEEVV